MFGVILVIALVGYGLLEVATSRNTDVGWVLIGIGSAVGILLSLKRKLSLSRNNGVKGGVDVGYGVYDQSGGSSSDVGGGGD